jgi:hypothetical protein
VSVTETYELSRRAAPVPRSAGVPSRAPGGRALSLAKVRSFRSRKCPRAGSSQIRLWQLRLSEMSIKRRLRARSSKARVRVGSRDLRITGNAAT